MENENKVFFNSKFSGLLKKKLNKVSSSVPIINLSGFSYLTSSSLITIDLKDTLLKVDFEIKNSYYINTYKNLPLFWNS
jgi:hypothetical protein